MCNSNVLSEAAVSAKATEGLLLTRWSLLAKSQLNSVNYGGQLALPALHEQKEESELRRCRFP